MKGTSSYRTTGNTAGGVEVPFSQRLAVGEFLDRLGQWDFTELLLRPLRDDYGKDVDGVNWDILNPGNRTGSGSGVTMTGAVATEQGRIYRFGRQAHLVRSPLVRLQIDNRSPSGPWKHRKPGEYDQSRSLVLYLALGADSHARERWRRASPNEALEEQVLRFNPAH
jgi:hypothetical protein